MIINNRSRNENLTKNFFYYIAHLVTKSMIDNEFNISFFHNIFNFYNDPNSKPILERFLCYLIHSYKLKPIFQNGIYEIALSKNFEYLPYVFLLLNPFDLETLRRVVKIGAVFESFDKLDFILSFFYDLFHNQLYFYKDDFRIELSRLEAFKESCEDFLLSKSRLFLVNRLSKTIFLMQFFHGEVKLKSFT